MAGLFCSPILIASRGKGAKGVARSGFPPACGASEWFVQLLLCGRSLAVFAGTLPSLDARLGSHGAVSESVRLVARLHDVTVVRQPVQQCRGYLGVAKHRRPFREAQVGGDHHTGVLVQLGEQVKQQCTSGLTERQIAQLIQND